MRDREWPDDTIKLILGKASLIIGGCEITDEVLDIIMKGNYRNVKFFSLCLNFLI